MTDWKPEHRQAAMDEASAQLLTFREGIDMVRPTEAFGMCYYAFLAGVTYARKCQRAKERERLNNLVPSICAGEHEDDSTPSGEGKS